MLFSVFLRPFAISSRDGLYDNLRVRFGWQDQSEIAIHRQSKDESVTSGCLRSLCSSQYTKSDSIALFIW